MAAPGYWNQRCSEAIDASASTRPLAIGSRSVLLALWCMALFAGGTVCCLWWRAGDKRRQAWNRYGTLALLVTLSSVAGIINSGANMKYKDLVLEIEQYQIEEGPLVSKEARRQREAQLLSEAYRWNGVSDVSYGFEVLFLISAKVQVMERLIFFAYLTSNPSLTEKFRDRVTKMQTFFFRFIFALNVIGIALLSVSAHYQLKASSLFLTSTEAYKQGDTALANTTFSAGYNESEEGKGFSASQNLVEAFVLSLIVLVFFFAGGRCIQRIRAQSRVAVGELKHKMYATIFLVFFAFALRTSFNFMVVACNVNLAFKLNQCIFNENCKRCGACQCYWRPIYWWLAFTPQVETAIMIVSGPTTLLVTLWGMTSERTRQVLLPSILESRCSRSMENNNNNNI